MIVFDDEHFMRAALKQADFAASQGEVPVGAVAVCDGRIIAKAYNQVELLKDATAHAEMLVLTQAAAALEDWRLDQVDIYVTKEPCAMCAGAMVNSRVRRVIYGMADPRSGAAGSALDVTGFSGMLHNVEVVSGVLEDDCKFIIQEFFKKVRIEKTVDR
jgi:tRNA(adenine34) deaminase